MTGAISLNGQVLPVAGAPTRSSHLDELLDLALRRAPTTPDERVVEPRARLS